MLIKVFPLNSYMFVYSALQGSAADEPNSETASYSLSKKSPFKGKGLKLFFI